MFNNISLSKKQKIIIFGTPIILILIIVVISIILMNQPHVSIKNFNEVKSTLTSAEKQNIEKSIFSLLEYNNDNPSSKTVTEAYIQADSYSENTDNGTLSVNFDVDIDQYERTFSVVFNREKGTAGQAYTNCAKLPMNKYPEHRCISESYDSNDISVYLPYYGNLTGGLNYTIRQTYYQNGDPYLQISVNSCGDKSIQDAALKATKDWVKSLYLDPDSYTYYVIPNLCDGGAS